MLLVRCLILVQLPGRHGICGRMGRGLFHRVHRARAESRLEAE